MENGRVAVVELGHVGSKGLLGTDPWRWRPLDGVDGCRRSRGRGRVSPRAAVITFDDADLALRIIRVDVIAAHLGRIAALGVAALVHWGRHGWRGRDCKLALAETVAAAIISLW